jgi:hypothetical protein
MTLIVSDENYLRASTLGSMGGIICPRLSKSKTNDKSKEDSLNLGLRSCRSSVDPPTAGRT